MEVSEKSLGSLWEVSGRFLKSLGKVSSGEWPPGGFWEVLDSKSGATVKGNAKILPKLVTLPRVFEGQCHEML